VLFPAKRDRHAPERQVHVGDDRTVLHPGASATSPTEKDGIGLLDRDLAGRPTTGVGEDADVFQAHEMTDDLGSIDVHRGVEELVLSHKRESEAPLCLHRGSPLSPRKAWLVGSQTPQKPEDPLIQDLEIRVVDENGELIRTLTLDPKKDFQRQSTRGTMSRDRCEHCRATSHGGGEGV
jgi:hypothetical protein